MAKTADGLGCELPGQIGIGWLKIRHTRESYAVWSDYCGRLLLRRGAVPCPASRQHRAFGVELHWGGFEYWAWPVKADEEECQESQSDYLLDGAPDDLQRLHQQGVPVRVPDGETVLTEWGDDALKVLEWNLSVDNSSVISLLGELLAAGATVTRLDLSADFASTVIEPVIASMQAGDYQPMRRHRFMDSRGMGPTGGRTCYFGVRGKDGGGVFVRFYEKGRESGLPVDLLRYEVELSGDKAHDAARKLVGVPAWDTVAAGVLAGAMDFRDGYGKQRGDAHAARDCERATWWTGLRARLAEAVKVERRARPDATLVSMREWVERGCGRVLAVLRSWMGREAFAMWLAGVIAKGEEKMTERDVAMLRIAAQIVVD
jgi:hypothetical protein